MNTDFIRLADTAKQMMSSLREFYIMKIMFILSNQSQFVNSSCFSPMISQSVISSRSLRELNISSILFEMPIWHLKNFGAFFINNAFKVANCDLKAKQTFESLLTMLIYPKHPLISFVFDNTCHFAVAFGAGAAQHQHAGLDLAGKVADGRLLSALNTPDVIQYFELNNAGNGLPDFLRLWRK